jgi:hydrogenase maturation protein HypF
VTGIVQGVGFRPFVCRLAGELGVDGLVGNDASSVFVEAEAPAEVLERFVERISSDAPPLAMVESVQSSPGVASGRRGFSIVASRDSPGAVTVVAPDTAVCDDCLAEMWDPGNRRYLHPFISCTNCGPRFTIITGVPYDRPFTTMRGFPLCEACRDEYDDPKDRRFHAQPISCHHCGPSVSYSAPGGEPLRGLVALNAAAAALAGGAILAVKGLGGYHLVCDATSDQAVGELRRRKGRAHKPFAVMAGDLDGARAIANLDTGEAALLSSPARPIVLCEAQPGAGLSPLVAPGNPMVGVMLAYTPLHHLLIFAPTAAGRSARLGPLVMTSSNPSGEPICYRDDDLGRRVGGIVDGVLGHDRPIHVPCDDSVVRVVDGGLLPLRRSRGYAPIPLRIPPGGPDALAVGAEMKNAFCVSSGSRAWMGQHIGDMGNLATLEAFERSVRQFCSMYRIEPEVVAVDAHPGYLSSRWGRDHYPGAVVEVQHHHAHVVSVIAENRLDPASKVIGVAFDGTGYGDDGAIWGGEILEADALDYRRVGHLREIPLPGGDAAVHHPWRVALAALRACGLGWSADLAPVAHAGKAARVLDRQLESGFNCVACTSMGRLFDAVSSLVGLRHDVDFEAQAAIDLEHAAARHLMDAPTWRFEPTAGAYDPAPVLAGIVDALKTGVPCGAVAAGFHLAVADMVSQAAIASADRSGCTTVALAGGVWQNKLLRHLTKRVLLQGGFDVVANTVLPPNDGGLALGQLVVATSRHAKSSDPPSGPLPGQADPTSESASSAGRPVVVRHKEV